MHSKRYSVRSMVESLEGRRMLSATGAEGAHVVPFIGPMEAHEYAVAQAQVKASPAPVGAAATTITDAQIPTPRTVIFWAKPQGSSSISGWLRSGSDD